MLTRVLLQAIRVGLVLLWWMPLVVTPWTFVPFIVGKAVYARSLIAIVTGLWVVLMVYAREYRRRARLPAWAQRVLQ